MNKRWMKITSLVLAGSLLLTACEDPETTTPTPVDLNSSKAEVTLATDMSKNPEAAKKRIDTFIAGMSSPQGVFNPYFYHNGWDGNVTSVLFASLVDVDSTGKFIPSLAEKWEVSDDQLTYTFKLREGLKFSDGSPLTAEDVAFTLTLLHDKAYDGETDISLVHVKGGKEYKEGKATSISGIEVIDPLTIKITTEKVNATALQILGGPVLSKAYYGKNYTPGNLDYIRTLHGKPLGAGPYKLEKYVPGQEVRFKANEHYFAGKPAVENFIYKVTNSDTNFQLFQTGETDYDGFTANPDTFEQLKGLGFANINVQTSTAYTYLDINHKKPYMQDKKFRQALMYGLDRKKIVDATFQGYGIVANEPISPISWAYTPDVNPYDYNPEKAKQLLEEAGWKVGADGIREKDGQKLKLTYLGRKGNDALITIAKQNYKDIGIHLDVEIMDFNAMLDKMKKGEYDLSAVSTPMIIDPAESAQNFLSTLADNGYNNPEVDQLILEGQSTLDVEKRKQVYHKLFKKLNDEVPVVFLWYRKVMSAHNGRIKGLEPNPYTGIISSLPKIKIE
jgi:peptide/nickel transport system substrate-binding protein